MKSAMRESPLLMNGPMVRAVLEGRKTVTRRIVKPAPYMQEVAGSYGGQLLCFPDRNKKGRGLIWPNAREAILEQCPYGQPGDRLWVKETFFAWGRWVTRFSAKKGRDEWHFVDMTLESGKGYLYAADGVSDTRSFVKSRSSATPVYWKRPAIFMPQTASRITLEVTGGRVEHLLDITHDQAIAEGVHRIEIGSGYPDRFSATPITWADVVEGGETAYQYAPLAFRDLWLSINGAGSWDANPWVWAIEFRRIEQERKAA